MSEPLCVRCARTQRTCCEGREIYLTPGDVRRVATHSGRPPESFSHMAKASASYLDQDDDPVWLRIFTPEGDRRILRHAEGSERCTFLGSAGCTLPPAVRPLVCMLFPFDYTLAGLLEPEEPDCPTRLLAPGESLLGSLGMNRERYEPIRAQLYREIEEEPHLEPHLQKESA